MVVVVGRLTCASDESLAHVTPDDRPVFLQISVLGYVPRKNAFLVTSPIARAPPKRICQEIHLRRNPGAINRHERWQPATPVVQTALRRPPSLRVRLREIEWVRRIMDCMRRP